MSVAVKESAPVAAQKNLRPITRFFILEAIIASGLFEPGLAVVDTYLKARTEFCFARAATDPTERRMLLGAGRENKRIAAGSVYAKKAFCRFMIDEASHRRKELLEIAEASTYRAEHDYFAERARISGRLAISWIKIRTHMETPRRKGQKYPCWSFFRQGHHANGRSLVSHPHINI